MIDCVVSETLFWNKTANIHQWKILELNLGPIWEPWQKSSHTWAILSISWSLRHWTLLVRLLSLLLPKTINTYLYTFKPQNKISFWNGVERDSLRRSQKFARSQIWFFFPFYEHHNHFFLGFMIKCSSPSFTSLCKWGVSLLVLQTPLSASQGLRASPSIFLMSILQRPIHDIKTTSSCKDQVIMQRLASWF